jgi:hypothetical protein
LLFWPIAMGLINSFAHQKQINIIESTGSHRQNLHGWRLSNRDLASLKSVILAPNCYIAY